MQSLLTIAKLRSLPPQSIAVIVGDSITVLAAIVATVILARLVEPKEMAIYRQIAFLSILAASILEMGFASGIYYFWPRFAGPARSSYLRMLVSVTLILGVAGFVVLLILARPLERAFGNEGLGEALRASAPFALGAVPFLLVRPVLISQGRGLRATLLEALMTGGAWGALILSLTFEATVAGSLQLWSSVNVLRLILVYTVVWRPFVESGGGWKPEIASEVWRYAWPLQLSRVPGLMSVYLDKIIGSTLLRPVTFATYSLGARELPFLSQFPFSMGAVFISSVAATPERQRVEIASRWWRASSIGIATLTYPIAAFCIWHAGAIVEILYTKDYLDATVPFSVFAGLTFIRTVEYGSIAKAWGKSHLILRASLLGPIVGGAIAIPMTKALGLLGLSVFAPVATVAIATYFLLSYRRLLKTAVRQFFPYDRLLGIAVAAFAAAWSGESLSTRLLTMLPAVASDSTFKLCLAALITAAIYVLIIQIAIVGLRGRYEFAGSRNQPGHVNNIGRVAEECPEESRRP